MKVATGTSSPVTRTGSVSGPLERYLILAARYFFGGHALISGANHYLQIVPDIMPRSPEIAARFMQVLLDTHLYDLVKGIEILTGLSLLTGLFVPVALVLEMPVTVIICYLSLFIAPTPRSLYTGPRELLLNLFLLSAYWGYLKPLVSQPKPALRTLWQELRAQRVEGGAS
jgi:riboflavin transporter